MTTRSGRGALAGLLLAGVAGAPARGGEAEVIAAEVRCDARRVCRFDVTVRHADEGWGHYADAWQVLAPDGAVLGTRELRHPHVDEQPFTRSLGGVSVPEGVVEVRVRARDSVHGWSARERTVAIPR